MYLSYKSVEMYVQKNKIFVMALAYFLFALAHFSFSQDITQVTVTENQVLGQFAETKVSLTGTQIHFSERIFKGLLDSLNSNALLQFRGITQNEKFFKNKGNIGNFNLITRKLEWVHSINYQNTFVLHLNHLLFRNQPLKSKLIELSTGNELWTVKANMLTADRKTNRVIGYSSRGKGSLTDLIAYDISTGKEVWRTEVLRKYGWRQVIQLKNGNLLISADGLHVINFEKGKLWEVTFKTGKERLNFWTTTNVFYNMNSNVVIDSSTILYANTTTMHKFDYNGDLIWQDELIEDETGTSFIFKRDSLTVLLVNTGYVNTTNNLTKPYGKSYFHVYDFITGKTIVKNYVTPIESILDFMTSHNRVYFMDKERLAVYDLSSGQLLHNKEFKTILGKLEGIMKRRVFIMFDQGDRFDEIIPKDNPKNEVILMTQDEHLIKLSEDLKIIQKLMYREDAYFLKYHIDDEYIIIGNEDADFIIDSAFKIKATFMSCSSYCLIDRQLYALDKDNLYILSLNELIPRLSPQP